jgi:hypothetical protein
VQRRKSHGHNLSAKAANPALHGKIRARFFSTSTMSHTPHKIERLLQQRILILDGAMGTMIQRYADEADYRGSVLPSGSVTSRQQRPAGDHQTEVIREIHSEYWKPAPTSQTNMVPTPPRSRPMAWSRSTTS